jgi:two-component system, LuxR family, response regulator FixJ
MADEFVAVVEDDAALRDALERLLRSEGFAARGFASAEEFLDDSETPRCLILDLRLPGMSGMELLTTLRQKQMRAPVVMITGHGDIPQAVAAVKAGAFDFIEKPYDPDALMAVLRKALDTNRGAQEGPAIAEIAGRAEALSPREREVMDRVVNGQPNKVIAAALQISPRTVEVYRANVMSKMQAKNLTDLVTMALRLRGAAP